MSTPLDKVMRSKVLMDFYIKVFSGLVTGALAWSLWGGQIFPAAADPTGDPEDWTRDELRRWLAARNLHPQAGATREELLERVKANMR
ncbi:hypothetical protein F4775DRAFT_597577 [Biscogniauxia sp. FL1348]|nr:hypothetical protein F4775DRAFT_597577 [Biscogniauxia sp. FL1348]